MTPNWKRFVWHYIVIFLILLAVVGFFYTRHRLIKHTEAKEESLSVVFENIPDIQRMMRNVSRWHDSSLIFATLRDFQAENDGDLPASWEHIPASLRGDESRLHNEFLRDEYLGESEHSDEEGIDIYFPTSSGDVSGDLPNEYSFHIFAGYVCAAGMRDDYQLNSAELTLARILERGQDSDFAIVYGAETPYDELSLLSSASTYIKCLDSLNGYDEPDFIPRFKI